MPPKPHWLICQTYLKVLIKCCHKSTFYLLNFDIWSVWGRTLGKWTILHNLGSAHRCWYSFVNSELSVSTVIQGSSVGTWATRKMKDNHSSGLHNVAPDLSCSNATKVSKTGIFLPGEFHGQRSLAGYSPWIAKSQTHLGVYHTLELPWFLRLWRICLQYGRPSFHPWAGKSPWKGG